MNPSSDPSSISSPPPASKKPSLYPPEPTYNPSIAPPFSKPPSFESMTSTLLQPTPSEQDANKPTTHPPPPRRPTLSSEYSSSHPFSAFYSHPTTRTSLEQAKSASKLNIDVYEHDLESQTGLTTTNTSTTNTAHNHHLHTQHHDHTSPTSTTTSSTPEKSKNPRPKRVSTMWLSPLRCAAKTKSASGSSALKKRHNITGTVRGSRACAPYRRLSRGQKWVVQILLAVVVVGAATALGVGISKAVGAGVWRSDTSTAPIGDVR